MRRSPYILPVLTLLLLGAGCALSSADSEKEAQVMESIHEEMSDDMVEAPQEEKKAEPSETEADAMVALSADISLTAQPEMRNINMKSGSFYFEPSVISAAPGEVMTMTFEDKDGHHTFVIDEIGLHEEISSGKVITFTAPQTPGRYSFYCDIGAHRALGMEGVLVVE